MPDINGNNYGYFWDSQGGDRTYNAHSFEQWLKKFFTTGVFTGDLQVTATSGMGISVAMGYTNIDGKVRFFDEATAFTLQTADANNPRIDTVVVERNDGNRNITLKLITGTPSATPVATDPIRTDGIYQLVLAQIYVGAAVSSVDQTVITDTRTNSSLCGLVAATVTEINFDQIYAQFETWFNTYKSNLDADVAVNLQTEINNLIESLDDTNDNLQQEIVDRTAITDKLPTTSTMILSHSSWGGEVYNLEGSYPSTMYDLEVRINEAIATGQQKLAWSFARCENVGSENKIRVNGLVPPIDIPVILSIKRR